MIVYVLNGQHWPTMGHQVSASVFAPSIGMSKHLWQIDTGNGRSYTHIALDVLSPMELRTPSCPKSHTHFERPWNADDFMFKLVKRKV